ncbi:MAG: NADP-dependent phosphogluconate dehydrogenase [Candidatus Brocadiae bacterium]|nr:NADP-dependent phosphogluconate dehydrogenase [Candidatus Brocadiia bacterium]
MNLGIAGLGVMGSNLALHAADEKIATVVWNRTTERAVALAAQHPGIAAAPTMEDLVRLLPCPRPILLMVPAGAPVDELIARLRPLLAPGDILLDGGNSWFQDTRRRADALLPSGVHFVGLGISGGEDGARHGPALMPGGPRAAFDALRPMLEALAAKTSAGPCVGWLGPGGAGHFVKMAHNGIEYGVMQAIAEAWDLLRRGCGLDADACADTFARWNKGPLDSFLMDLTARILRVRDPETGRPLVDLVLDHAAQKGTGRWTVQAALELGVPVPTLAAALDARLLSTFKDERVRLAAAHPLPHPPPISVEEVHAALRATTITAYLQGYRLITAAAAAHGWGTDLAEVRRIWRGGCIIRAALLDHGPRFEDLPHAGWRAGIAGIPTPAMSAALAWYDALRTADLPQNLTQAQRDAFGAHTYVRRGREGEGAVHSEWGGEKG